MIKKRLLVELKFAIAVKGMKFKECVDGVQQCLKHITKCRNGEMTHLGEFKGFELLVEKNLMGVNYMVLRG